MCNETQQFKIGQQVKILNGCGGAKPYIGHIGVIHDFDPIGVKFNDGNVWYFNNDDLEFVVEQITPICAPQSWTKGSDPSLKFR